MENSGIKSDVWIQDATGVYNYATGLSPVTSYGYIGGGTTPELF